MYLTEHPLRTDKIILENVNPRLRVGGEGTDRTSGHVFGFLHGSVAFLSSVPLVKNITQDLIY